MPRAVFLTSPGKIEARDVDKPAPGPAEVLIRVHAAALNPTDVKHIDNKYPVVEWGTILGCDFAGIVEEIGSSVPAGLRTVGQRVAGAVHGASSPHSGAFADYVVTDPRLLVTLPDNITFDDAAGLGLCGITASQMLYQSQNLPKPQFEGGPTQTGKKILVWSGASAVGQLIIQIAASAGLEVLTTASPRHSQHLLDLGASAVFNYADSDVGEQIRKHTNGTLDSAADCFSDGDSIKKIFDAIGPKGGTVSLVMPVKTDGLRQDVEVTRSTFYTTFGKPIRSPYPGGAVSDHYVSAVEYYETISRLIGEGRLRTIPIKLFHGLESVQEGVDYLRSGKVSGEKITFKLL